MPCFQSLIYLCGYNFEQLFNSICINQPVKEWSDVVTKKTVFNTMHDFFPHHADVQGYMRFMGGSEAENNNNTTYQNTQH